MSLMSVNQKRQKLDCIIACTYFPFVSLLAIELTLAFLFGPCSRVPAKVKLSGRLHIEGHKSPWRISCFIVGLGTLGTSLSNVNVQVHSLLEGRV